MSDKLVETKFKLCNFLLYIAPLNYVELVLLSFVLQKHTFNIESGGGGGGERKLFSKGKRKHKIFLEKSFLSRIVRSVFK